jgi:alkylation response protein AidB-like acyl-CoA dehydrogenase
MRDFRINLIFEGSSEIMRLFIAREAVDHHFKTAFDLVNPEATRSEKRAAFLRSVKFYPGWYASRWIGRGRFRSYSSAGRLATHLRYIEKMTRKLGRAVFHAMVKLGPKLEKRQMVLFRAVDIGAELFAMAATCSRAEMLANRGDSNALALADLFCREARLRIASSFRMLYGPNDKALYRTAMDVLDGKYAWLERGIIGLPEWPAKSGAKAKGPPLPEEEAAGVG